MSIRSNLFERLKKTVMVWVAVYPSAVIVLALVGDVLRDWPLPFQVLGATVLIVAIVANITEPAVKAAVVAIKREWARWRSPARE